GFFIDGHPAVYLYHLLGGPGVIHPELIGGLSFYPGGYPARYGRYAAGAIAVDTKEPPRDRWHLDADFNLFQAGLLFSVPFDDKKGEVTLSFRRSYYELLLPLFTDDATLSFTDYLARVSYDFAPGLRGRFIALGAIDEASTRNVDTADGDGTSSTSIGIGFHRLNLALDADLSRDVTWTNSVAWEYEYTNNRRVAQGDEDLSADLGGWFLSARSFVVAKALKELTIESGVDLLYLNFSADLKIPTGVPLGDPRPPAFDPVVTPFSLGEPTLSVAPYVSADVEVVPGLRLLPGFRLTIDDYGDRAHVTVDPKLAVRWAIDDQWTLKGMAALAHQAPNAFQVSPPFGEPGLPLTEAIQGSVGFEWKPEPDWLVSVEGFVQYLDQLPEPANDLADDEGDVGRVYWDSDLRGRAFGLEVMIRKDFGGLFYGWLTYTLSRAERFRGADRGWNLFELDQTHILNLAWTVRLGREWQLGARFQLASGNPFYPIDGGRYDADTDRFVPTYAASQSRLAAYHRLDIRLDKRWRFEDWMFEFYLDIQNVYNQQNSESPAYSFDYKTKTDGPALPFLPTLGVRAVF
ncbi:MAG: TonB-dependent receptor, partial [Myxococcales bacterium]|nr:TonB-dependent receptor [Myxococcales bacterium]